MRFIGKLLTFNKCRACRQRRFCHNNRKLPQHAPLYAALFCSIVAITLSACTYTSARFVDLEEPIRVSPFFKNVNYIGLSTWELCVMKQDALSEVIENGIESSSIDTTSVTAQLPALSILTTTDIQRNVTSYVQTNYHHTQSTAEQSISWMVEPDHDDILVSADYPYNDDDGFESDFPMSYWNCHYVHITSKGAGSHGKWNISRVFFMLGFFVGMISTAMLIALIVFRSRDAAKIWNQRQEETIRIHQSSDAPRISQQDRRSSATAGYRPVSICFLMCYLLQSVTLLFLDSQICRVHTCSISTGAQSLLGACVLWVLSGILILFTMKKTLANERKDMQLKRKREREQPTFQHIQSKVTEGDESILPKSQDGLRIEIHSYKDERLLQEEENVLNVTGETECSSSLQLLDEEKMCSPEEGCSFHVADQTERSASSSLASSNKTEGTNVTPT